MTALLDAHALLWAIYLPERLSEQILKIISNPGDRRLVSEATQWELLNKVGRGRIPFTGSSVPAVSQRIRDLQVEFVPILQADTVSAAMLPHHHSDPFDRMLIAQSIRLNCTIATKDSALASYGIATIW